MMPVRSGRATVGVVDGESTTSEEHDSRILAISDHGVDPSPMPRGRHMRSEADDQQGGGWGSLLIWCGVPIIVMLLIRMFLFGFYVIPSGSMRDTIEVGDRVITTLLAPKHIALQRGDIVVFTDPANWLQSEDNTYGSNRLIKRLIGMPGDTVACAGPGQPVTINGVAIDESSYIRPGVDPSSFAFNVTVTADHVFVMGDNRSNSADSRYHQDDGSNGLVPIDDVEGVALFTYWPISRMGVLDAHHEVFENVPNGNAQ